MPLPTEMPDTEKDMALGVLSKFRGKEID